MPKALIQTYGCTLNQADSDAMEAILKGRGIDVEREGSASDDNYDYVIINTCTVKTATEQRILERLKRLQKLGRRLIVTGCMASANEDKVLGAAPDSSLVTTSNTHRIADALSDISNGSRAVYDAYVKPEKQGHFRGEGSAIARIPISEGCLSSCSFCETKFARGPLNSFSSNVILRSIEMAIKGGAREIELTSQDTGAYGADRRTDIAELVHAASELDGDFRIRIGMLNPEHLHKYIDSLIDAYKSDNVYKFAHLPVQSGSDRVLRDMGRNYLVEEFEGMANELKSKIPEISIATDMIVGYPTESDPDFEMSMRLIERVGFSRINVSRFSKRPHAGASKLKQLKSEVVKQRCISMYRLSRRMEIGSLTKVVGERRTILLTERNADSITGRDQSYRQVALREPGFRVGEFVDVEIIGNTPACLIGRPVGTVNKIEQVSYFRS
jgi:MiaB-like tRNA modifying enzyme